MSAPATLTEAQRREAWLADRRTCITGTDVAAILGLSRFSSPIQVYLDKKGLAETMENEAMRWGKRLERPILEAYAEKEGVAVQFADPYTLHRVPGFHLLGASLDAVRLCDNAPVDAKNTRQRSADWGPDGSDQIPVYYAAQLAVQMMVQDAAFADLAVLFSGQELATFRVWRDLETEAAIRERVALWWERHIVQDIPPDPDGSDSSSRYLAQRFSRHGAELLQPTPEQLDLARQLARVKAEAKRVEAEQARLENLLKLGIGGAAGLAGVCTWKAAKDSDATDWKALAGFLGATAPDIAKFTTTKPGSRRFLLTLKEAE